MPTGATRLILCLSRYARATHIRGSHFPDDADHMDYLLEYNTRFMSGNESAGYSFQYLMSPSNIVPM